MVGVQLMALAEMTHYTAPRRERMARAGEWVRDAPHGEAPEEPTPQEPGTRFCDFDDDSVPELGSSRADRLADVRPQERVQRHTVEQNIGTFASCRCSMLMCH